MKRLLFILIFILIGCEERSLLVSDIASDTGTDEKNGHQIGSFYIEPVDSKTFNIRHNNLLLSGNRDEMFSLSSVDIGYEMMYGAFKSKDRIKKGWTAVDRIEYESISNNEMRVKLFIKDNLATIISLINHINEYGEYLEISYKKDDDYNRISLSLDCANPEHFIGFGAQSIDVDHFGNTLSGWVQEQGIGKVMHDNYNDLLWYVQGRKHSSHIPIPQILSSRNYILTVKDNIRPLISLCSDNSNTIRIEAGADSSIYIFPSNTPIESLKLATSVTGRSRIPPDFAFFPWIDAIFGSENVRRVAHKLRDEKIPASAIWTEDYKGAEFKGERYVLSEGWEIDRNLYPDFEELAKELHNLGFKFLTYFNSFVYKDSDAFEELDKKGLLIKDKEGKTYLFDGAKGSKSSLLDLLNEESVLWLKSKMKDTIDRGSDGWMGDFAEWLPTDAVLYDSKNGQNVSGLEVHNNYPVLWQRVQRELIDSYKDGVDRIFFVRSGWFGTPGLADVVWAGDQRTSFDIDDGLPTIIPIGIGLSICGISNYSHDIAGYQSMTNPPSDRELFYRWTELGAYTPIMRTHHGYMPKLNWSWERDEETTQFFRKYAQIHSSLFPYFRTLAVEASKTGIPIMRSLALHYPDEEIVWDLKDEYLLGEDILVAPIIQRDQRTKRLYLPSGRWTPIEQTGEYIEGGRYITIDAPLEYIPVFVREGGIIPMIKSEILTNVDIDNSYKSSRMDMNYRILKIFLGKGNSFTEFNGNRYTLDMISDYDKHKALMFSLKESSLKQCEEEQTDSCYKKLNDHLYVIYLSSKESLSISQEQKKIADLKITTPEPIGLEIHLYY